MTAISLFIYENIWHHNQAKSLAATHSALNVGNYSFSKTTARSLSAEENTIRHFVSSAVALAYK